MKTMVFWVERRRVFEGDTDVSKKHNASKAYKLHADLLKLALGDEVTLGSAPGRDQLVIQMI